MFLTREIHGLQLVDHDGQPTRWARFSPQDDPGKMRAAIEKGELEWEEYSHFGMITRLQAGAGGLPFLPMNQTGATDLEKSNPLIKRVTDPYSGKELIAVPALNPASALPMTAP